MTKYKSKDYKLSVVKYLLENKNTLTLIYARLRIYLLYVFYIQYICSIFLFLL